MSKTVEVDVHHITRVEGHGNIKLRAKDGKVEQVKWQVPEAPRFFEAMVRGRHYQDIQTVVSRICGICSISHSMTAIKAVENALGIKVSQQTDDLRHLMHYSEQLQSHVLHVGYLVAPDLFNVKSVVPLVSTHLEVVKTIIGLHKVANDFSELLAGRITHPITIKPGGFSKIPTEKQLKALKDQLAGSVPALKTVAEVVLSVAGKIPDFRRSTEYIALVEPGRYTFYHGDIGSTDTQERVPVSKFETVTNEYMTDQSTAKWAKWHRASYAAGALARYNLNAPLLMPLAKTVAKQFKLEQGCCNPFMNSVAQLIECVHVVEASIELIDKVLTRGLKAEEPKSAPREGEGAGATEAPRGILFHRYAFDKKGICQKANMIIPTNQNHGNIQKDFEEFAPAIIDRPQDEVRLLLEMLVRAYDPCISCSTHYLDVEFV